MKLLEKLFNNPKPARWAIVGFIILFFFLIFHENANAETRIDMGIPMVSLHYEEPTSDLIFSEIFDKWVVGMGLIGEQTDKYDREVGNNMFAFGERRVCSNSGKMCLGLGLAYFQHTSFVVGSNLNYTLSIEYNFEHKGWLPDYFVIRHFSNAGTSPPNPGQNLFNFGYSFGK